jgi:hypothetical protein
LAAIGIEILLGASEHDGETDISRGFIEAIVTPSEHGGGIGRAEGKREYLIAYASDQRCLYKGCVG